MRVGQIDVDVTVEDDIYSDNIPLDSEDLGMPHDEIKKLVGDGEARVSVSTKLDDKDYGSGFGTFVTVSLTCDQNSDSLDDAFVIANALSSEYADQAYDEAEELFRKKTR